MTTKGTDQLNREDYLTYEEAADFLSVSVYSLAKACEMGTFMPIRLDRSRHKYIPRYEVEAAKKLVAYLSSRTARDTLDKVRRERSIAMGEKEYNIDGTTDYVPESELGKIVESQRLIISKQE